MKHCLVLFACLWLINPIKSQIPQDSIYFGFDPPGDSAIVFAPGIISLDGRNERTPNYLPDYSEFYFTSGTINYSESFVYQTTYNNDMWEATEANLAFTGAAWDLSLTDSTMACFTSRVGDQTDIFTINRTGGNWGSPVKLPSQINSSLQEWGACILQNKTVYFCRYINNQGDIFKSVFSGGVYLPAEKLNINTGSQEWDPYIPEDESYIIFKSDRTGGYGNLDLYICYRKEDGSYTNPKNLGSKINTPGHDDCGNLTPDGNYFMFARGNADAFGRDIYWVKANFIDSLRYTNFIPYLKNNIPDQTDTIGNYFSYTIPDSIFIDDDGNETLSITAMLSDGNDLPDSLTFSPSTNTISGKLINAGIYTIKITATDTAGASISDIFRLIVKQSTNISANYFEPDYLEVYPNPANQTIHIRTDKLLTEILNYRILDINGKVIKQGKFITDIIDISNLTRGIYILNLQTNKSSIFQRFVIE